MKRTKYRLLITVVVAGASLVMLTVLCRLFWLHPIRIAGRSMELSLKIDDIVFVNKLSYFIREPKKGDVVFIDTTKLPLKPAARDKRWIKRVVGNPGDRISIHPPYVHINGDPLNSPEIFATISERKKGYQGYLLPDITKHPNSIIKRDSDEIVLADNEYFLLGDNTSNSHDSRHFGPVPRSAIIGKLSWIIAPSKRRGIVK
ncbi:MAG: signal peptidase I [Planctomycetota bacterium]